MRIEEQVISVNLAEQMKDRGFVRDSYWYWIKPTKDHWNYDAILGGAKWELMPGDEEIDADDEGRAWTVRNECVRNNSEFYETFPAFTSVELSKFLPEEIHDRDDRLLVRFSKYAVYYYANTDMRQPRLTQSDASEANARAKMVICLYENKLL